MFSPKPFLIRALYEWIVHNEKTPFLLVNTLTHDLKVPQQFLSAEKVTLDISPRAVRHLHLGNEHIEFDASFSGMLSHLIIPVEAIEGVCTHEERIGMVFVDKDLLSFPPDVVFEPYTDDSDPEDQPPPFKGGKPHLKVIK